MQFISNSASETKNIGSIIARNLLPGDIICLIGELGSGKTVLAKGIASGLRMGHKKVISPSFVLIREHRQGRLPMYHFDLYRLNQLNDILSLGYEDYLYAQGVSVIEWAQRLEYLFPSQCLKVEFFLKPGKKRVLKFSAKGNRYKKLLEKIHENIGN
ncbi:MAG: tRNA (adenosine(37)-N6)-threonylcarbamoyltransferase complex ATPase subunit type 1 TsaE [Candidatus Omnitrophica bacterium]|nr:tRNA (adenosine(37)-N6)-threonylcarbamoyltransferase complex ATPase subunit type 1 TsaE [Candidatus Omnitrophota bacterium]